MTTTRALLDAQDRPSGPGGLSRWLPVVVWALVISGLSTDAFSGEHTGAVLLPVLRFLLPTAAPETLRAVHEVVRKIAHPTEYAILGWLLARALDQPGRSAAALAALAIAFAAAYASLDELHQLFVPSRTAALGDVLLDTTGAAVGAALRAFGALRALSGDRRSRA